MRLCFLSGGTGTPKLLRGYTKLDPFFSVIVNVADDLWISGNKVCPDIDSVIYAIADVIDDSKWWGLRGDTFRTYDMLKTLGFNEMLKIGDLDRAVHIARSELLRKGYTLTQATRIVKNAFNIKAEILPACEENVQTYIKTSEGMMHFQEFWVLKKGKLDVEDIVFRGIGKAVATDDVFRAMETSDAIVVGPSNPITSIMPIISVKGIKRMLKKKFVVAVSPIIGKKPVSGPAAKLMKAKGFEVSADGVADCYSDFLDLIVVHSGDRCNYKYVETDIVMRDKKDEIRLAKFIVDLVKKYI